MKLIYAIVEEIFLAIAPPSKQKQNPKFTILIHLNPPSTFLLAYYHIVNQQYHI